MCIRDRFLFFLGYTQAYKAHQSRLIIKEALLVGFFLAGLVVLGGMQQWWLQPIVSGLEPRVLFFGALALTAVTDNAALTCLGSLIDGISAQAQYMLVAGAVAGGGLTVIANAPNPAGVALLRGGFNNGAVSIDVYKRQAQVSAGFGDGLLDRALLGMGAPGRQIRRAAELALGEQIAGGQLGLLGQDLSLIHL